MDKIENRKKIENWTKIENWIKMKIGQNFRPSKIGQNLDFWRENSNMKYLNSQEPSDFGAKIQIVCFQQELEKNVI